MAETVSDTVRLTKAQLVRSLVNGKTGDTRRINSTPGGHPADGLTADVLVSDCSARHTIIDPTSFANGGPEWVMRYGNPESIRYAVASLLESYDGLLSPEITSAEAARRLRLMRAARAALESNSHE